MKILKAIHIIVILCHINVKVCGQDTTYIDLPTKYYSKNGDSYRFDLSKYRKGPKVSYSRELIQFSKDIFKIENCYYYDNKRCTNYFSTDYKIINDSIIKINKEKWHFQKISDSLYNVTKVDIDYIEKGTVGSLISFTKKGDFITCNLRGKPMFIEKFGDDGYKIECIKYDLKDTIYTIVDKKAKFPENYGNIQRYISERLRLPEIT